MLASGVLMAFRADSHLLNMLPEGWDPGAVTLGVAGAGFVVSRPWGLASATACSASALA